MEILRVRGVVRISRSLTEEQFASFCREFGYNSNGDYRTKYEKMKRGRVIIIDNVGGSLNNYISIRDYGRTIHFFPNEKNLDRIISLIDNRNGR